MKSKTPKMTANEFTDVKDIRDIFLYTRDTNRIFCYLRIYPFNIDLLTGQELDALTNRLAATFDGDRKDFVYCAFPRELDLDKYKSMLKERRMQELDNLGNKHIIDELIKQATELSSNHENFEHQHFYKFWKDIDSYTSKAQAELELRERIVRFRDMYKGAQIGCEILGEKEIIKLCNLYSNSRSANYEISNRSMLQPEIPMLR